MNYIEEHGKKVAAVLCVASCFPVVAAVYAMETEPGWHGDRYVNEDATVATGWQEIEGKSYYFDEDGQVDQEATQKATVATVSTKVATTVQASVTETTKQTVQQEVEIVEEQKEKEQQASEEVQVEEVVETPETPVETPVEPVVPETPAQPETPVQPETPATPETPSVPETPSQPVVPETPVQPETPTTPETPSVPETPEETPEQQPTTPDTGANTGSTDSQYAALNQRIVDAALALVGTTDGLQCTQVVQMALANAGVNDAYQLWPDQYVGQYGYYTDTPQAGNLVYYNNGGRGVDHIAIYIGNGLCVHGNFWIDGGSYTVIESVYNGGGGTPQFIQVVR